MKLDRAFIVVSRTLYEAFLKWREGDRGVLPFEHEGQPFILMLEQGQLLIRKAPTTPREAFMALPIEERRKAMEEQAKELAEVYTEKDDNVR